MLRVVASLAAVPVVLVALLAAALGMHEGKLGSLSTELFELGPLPVVLLVSAVTLVVFVPMLLLTSRFLKISLWTSVAVGFLSALLPVLGFGWSLLIDDRLRMGFRVERFAQSYPWLAMGLIGGVLFWLFAVVGNRALGHQLERPR